MRRNFSLAVIGLVLLLTAESSDARPAETLNLNEFITAESLDAGLTQAGVHLTLGERYQSYYPSFRYGLGGLFEVGARAGIVTAGTSNDSKVGALVGADIKFQLVKQTEGIPVDMAVDLGFDTNFVNSRNVSDLRFSTIFSRAFPLTERGYKATPYGGLELSILNGSYFNERETDYYILGGLEWKFTQKSMLYLEVKTGDHTLGGFGVRFEY